MSRSKSSIVHQSDTLARAYLALLSGQNPTRPLSPRGRKKDRRDPVASLLDEFEAPKSDRVRRLRPDLAIAAVLVARAVDAVQGLAQQARSGQVIMTIGCGTADLVSLVREVVETCVLSTECEVVREARQIGYTRPADTVYIINRDGQSKDHRPELGNDGIAAAVHGEVGVIGIAPDPHSHLPSDLTRLADMQLELPPIDNEAISLLLEHLCGARPSVRLDETAISSLDIRDIALAVRPTASANECIQRLKELIIKKTRFTGDGPRLEDLAGYGDAKQWGLEAISDLEDLRAGRIAWAEFDHRGLLLAGPPGVGKSSFVAALARSAGVPLIATSVASWNAATYLSGTLQAMNEAFSKARRTAPSILFIDEIDGISDRSAVREHREYWLQIVNRLLELLQGVDDREGVIVIAATNYPNAVDAAVRRAGRLDRQIDIHLPEPDDLTQIFRHYLGDDLTGADLASLGEACRGFTGADVETIVRRARGAARRRREPLELSHLVNEVAPPTAQVNGLVRRCAAIHEAGHAIVALKLKTFEVVSANIRGMDGLTRTKVDEEIADESWLNDVLAVCMAGRAAERIALGRVTAGAGGRPGSDLDIATRIAIEMEIRFGFGADGPLYFDCRDRGQALSLPGVMEAVRSRIASAEARAGDIINTELAALTQISEALLVNDELDGTRLQELLDGQDRGGEGAANGVSPSTGAWGRAA